MQEVEFAALGNWQWEIQGEKGVKNSTKIIGLDKHADIGNIG